MILFTTPFLTATIRLVPLIPVKSDTFSTSVSGVAFGGKKQPFPSQESRGEEKQRTDLKKVKKHRKKQQTDLKEDFQETNTIFLLL